MLIWVNKLYQLLRNHIWEYQLLPPQYFFQFILWSFQKSYPILFTFAMTILLMMHIHTLSALFVLHDSQIDASISLHACQYNGLNRQRLLAKHHLELIWDLHGFDKRKRKLWKNCFLHLYFFFDLFQYLYKNKLLLLPFSYPFGNIN